jgi:small-conductance mechanosensitive channel
MLPGFNLNTLSLVLGAVSFGLGFGLRNIADNFVSGLILLIERPIKVGDRIQVDDLEGQVVEVRARSTTVRTNDNIDIIVPNAEFVAARVTNLSHNDNQVRFRLPVGVHYQSDVRAVETALLAAAAACPDVLVNPEPQVRFMGFGESSLDFELRVWSESLYNRPNKLRSQVNFLIWEEFQRRGIQIPYPQRDLYVKEWPSLPPSSAGTQNGKL